ncbi:hypothetical protein OH76DRAFT_1552166 [Lentinus brumalis]|uniref:Uncharacterized protein n=1 Tax=Lentinus brumalis TaxID=2498619 RepID=A0A371DQS4_9APHY|nr:hypothetical protein OH76DRAFT_1552166 [Polyporus brumalis]
MSTVVEQIERVAGDISHVGGVAKSVYKLTMIISKKHIGEITEAGKLELHYASQILLDPLNEQALEDANLYTVFREDYSGWCQRFAAIEQQLKNIKFWDIMAKRALYLTALAEVEAVTHFKLDVRRKSTWARLRLNIEDGSLDTANVPINQQTAQNMHPQAVETDALTQLPPSPSMLTLVAGLLHDALDHGHQVHSAENVDEDAYSDTDSCFGNPWLKGESQPHRGDDTYVLSIHVERADTGTS